MKFKKIINGYEKELAVLKAKRNMLSEDDAKAIDEQIATINDRIQALKDDAEEHDMSEVMQSLKDLTDKLTALTEKVEEKPAGEPAAENFLKSRNSVKEWLRAIRSSNGRGAQAFRTEWAAILKENGITITDGDEFAFTPDYVRGKIQDAWDKNSNWLNQLNNTGAKRFAVRYDSTSEDTADGRARGHKNGEQKGEISATMVAKEVNAKFIYALCGLDNLTEYEDDGSLVNYITDTLYNRFLYEVRRAILIGDGRSEGVPDLRIQSFEAYKRNSTDAFVTVADINSSNALIDELVTNLASIKNAEDDITLFMNRGDLNTLRRVQFGDDATPQYVSKEVVAEQLGVKEIIVTDMMDSSTSDAVRFVAARLGGYVTVGNLLSPAFDAWEDKLYNKQYYRLESPCGGAVEALKSAVVLCNA